MMTKELELYIHIPFCVRKCRYCDFLSAAYEEGTKTAYMQALFQEIGQRAADCQGYEVVSVFIGGGTPSVLGVAQIEKLMGVIRSHYILRQDAEITIEVNPGTVENPGTRKMSAKEGEEPEERSAGGSAEEKSKPLEGCRMNTGQEAAEKRLEMAENRFDAYRKAGINRLSIGLQSANDGELKALGRIHTFQNFLDTYQAALEAGFDNINVDLMSGIPGQTLESYEKTLRTVISLDPAPTHISAYSLIVEEGTPFFELQKEGRLMLPDEETDREMYHLTKSILKKAGYERYEISNYAKKGYECRHNIGYWKRAEYLGFGIGAASLFRGTRFKNGENIREYCLNPCGVREESEILDKKDCMEEFMFLGLRMMEGVSFTEFRCCFGEELGKIYGAVIEKNIKDGLMFVYEKSKLEKAYKPEALAENNCLALTDKGIDVSNYVMAQFLI